MPSTRPTPIAENSVATNLEGGHRLGKERFTRGDEYRSTEQERRAELKGPAYDLWKRLSAEKVELLRLYTIWHQENTSQPLPALATLLTGGLQVSQTYEKALEKYDFLLNNLNNTNYKEVQRQAKDLSSSFLQDFTRVNAETIESSEKWASVSGQVKDITFKVVPALQSFEGVIKQLDLDSVRAQGKSIIESSPQNINSRKYLRETAPQSQERLLVGIVLSAEGARSTIQGFVEQVIKDPVGFVTDFIFEMVQEKTILGAVDDALAATQLIIAGTQFLQALNNLQNATSQDGIDRAIHEMTGAMSGLGNALVTLAINKVADISIHNISSKVTQSGLEPPPKPRSTNSQTTTTNQSPNNGTPNIEQSNSQQNRSSVQQNISRTVRNVSDGYRKGFNALDEVKIDGSGLTSQDLARRDAERGTQQLDKALNLLIDPANPQGIPLSSVKEQPYRTILKPGEGKTKALDRTFAEATQDAIRYNKNSKDGTVAVPLLRRPSGATDPVVVLAKLPASDVSALAPYTKKPLDLETIGIHNRVQQAQSARSNTKKLEQGQVQAIEHPIELTNIENQFSIVTTVRPGQTKTQALQQTLEQAKTAALKSNAEAKGNDPVTVVFLRRLPGQTDPVVYGVKVHPADVDQLNKYAVGNAIDLNGLGIRGRVNNAEVQIRQQQKANQDTAALKRAADNALNKNPIPIQSASVTAYEPTVRPGQTKEAALNQALEEASNDAFDFNSNPANSDKVAVAFKRTIPGQDPVVVRVELPTSDLETLDNINGGQLNAQQLKRLGIDERVTSSKSKDLAEALNKLPNSLLPGTQLNKIPTEVRSGESKQQALERTLATEQATAAKINKSNPASNPNVRVVFIAKVDGHPDGVVVSVDTPAHRIDDLKQFIAPGQSINSKALNIDQRVNTAEKKQILAEQLGQRGYLDDRGQLKNNLTASQYADLVNLYRQNKLDGEITSLIKDLEKRQLIVKQSSGDYIAGGNSREVKRQQHTDFQKVLQRYQVRYSGGNIFVPANITPEARVDILNAAKAQKQDTPDLIRTFADSSVTRAPDGTWIVTPNRTTPDPGNNQTQPNRQIPITPAKTIVSQSQIRTEGTLIHSPNLTNSLIEFKVIKPDQQIGLFGDANAIIGKQDISKELTIHPSGRVLYRNQAGETVLVGALTDASGNRIASSGVPTNIAINQLNPAAQNQAITNNQLNPQEIDYQKFLTSLSPELVRSTDPEKLRQLYNKAAPQNHFTGRANPVLAHQTLVDAIQVAKSNPNAQVHYTLVQVPANLAALNKSLGAEQVNKYLTELATLDKAFVEEVRASKCSR